MSPAQVRTLLKKYLVDPDELVRAGSGALKAVEATLPAILTGTGTFLLSHLLAQEVGLEPRRSKRGAGVKNISPQLTIQLSPFSTGLGYKQAGSVGESIEPPENQMSWIKSEQNAKIDDQLREKDARHMLRKVLRGA
jgi:hypothetical protein